MAKIVLALSMFFFFVAEYQVANASLAKQENSFFEIINETPVKKIVKRIAKENIYVVTPINSKIVSSQEQNYVDLLKIASIEELTQLAAEDKNAIVRLYAFRALMESIKDVPKDIFKQFLNDTTPVKVIEGTRTDTKPLNSIANGFLY